MTEQCECGNEVEPGESQCVWCLYPECEILVEVQGPPAGKRIGICVDGRPIYRSWFAGTIYHSSEH